MTGAWAQWNTQFVDNEGNTGKHTKMVLDSNGRPHIFYVTDDVHYHHAWWTGLGWGLERLFSSPSAVNEAELDGTVDRNGNWYLCWIRRSHSPPTRSELYYSTNERDTVLTWIGDGEYYYVAIALDTSGFPHIVDYNSQTNQLEHWWKSSSGWRMDTIESYSPDIRRPSMVIDNQNHIYVAYYKSGDLKLAVRDGAVWGTSYVDLTNDVGDYCSLKLDQTGRVCISYYDATNRDLKYAVGTPSLK